jgi:hypothetical protein
MDNYSFDLRENKNKLINSYPDTLWIHEVIFTICPYVHYHNKGPNHKLSVNSFLINKFTTTNHTFKYSINVPYYIIILFRGAIVYKQSCCCSPENAR